jgi:hypothetical protein
MTEEHAAEATGPAADEAASAKQVAGKFGALEPPREVTLEDLEVSEEASGGLTATRTKSTLDTGKIDSDAHGCPACPHTATGPAATGPASTGL